MLRYRTQGILAVGLGIFAGGCFGDPDILTDLRPEGPPDVLVGMAQSVVSAEEHPFFCRYVNGAKDEKAPGFVIDAILGSQTVCPDVESEFAANDADPRGYAIRIMFDELLNADRVETLICDEDGACVGSLETTQPVTFMCGTTAVDYDGYYVPNGNNTTFPLGPSLLVQPLSLDIATGTTCTVTLGDNVVDKSGTTVPAAEAALDFKIADLALLETVPADAEDVADREVIDPDGEIEFSFNAAIDDASIAASEIEIVNGAGAVIPSTFYVDDSHASLDAIFVHGTADLPAGNYTVRIKSGAVIEELNGGTITFAANEDVRVVVE